MSGTAFPRWQSASAGVHLAVAVVTAALVGGITFAVVDSGKSAGLAAWIGAALVFLTWTWASTWPMDAARTQALAGREDSLRALADVLLMLVAIGSVVIVAVVIIPASTDEPHYIVLGVLSIALSWLVVHTVFTLRYARMYYGDPVGGIDFGHDEQPEYRDFYYVGFTVGMTFQVSDTTVRSRDIRMTILRQSLISFGFLTVIIAVMINVLASLGKG